MYANFLLVHGLLNESFINRLIKNILKLYIFECIKTAA